MTRNSNLIIAIDSAYKVAAGVLEPSDHLGTHPSRFVYENRS